MSIKAKSFFLTGLFILFSSDPVLAGSGLESAQRAITNTISMFTIVAAGAGIIKGAIQIRKGVNSEGMSTIAGSCICLFLIGTLYLIVSFIGEAF